MVKNLLIFAAGAVVGSAVTWKIVKTKYEQIAQEEIDSVKEVFSRRLKEESENDEEDSEEEDSEFDNEDVEEANDIINNMGYSSYSKKKRNKNKEIEHDDDDELVPYVISPDDFGEDGYDTVSLTYYADGVLADDYDEVVEDRELLIGNYALDRFGEYEPDIVHVRNEENQTDYEICKDVRNYSDVISTYKDMEG